MMYANLKRSLHEDNEIRLANNTSAEVKRRNTYIMKQKKERHNRVIRLFVLSSGYVATFTNSLDETYWGSTVIPLAFGSEVSAQRAVDIIQSANPKNLVVFSGGLFAFKQWTSEHTSR